jgi:C1A family cysteine protease
MLGSFLTVLAILACSSSALLFTENQTEQKSLWEGFKKDFKKVYSTFEEEKRRFYIFLENLQLADHRNSLEINRKGMAVHGITKFSDISQAEYESKYLTADRSLRNKNIPVEKSNRKVDASLGLVDWTGKYTTEVKDQGYCGSCWAFSVTEQIESAIIISLDQTFLLSAEQITQCTNAAFGCGGGWTTTAYDYVRRIGGIETEADYPYSSYYGTTGICAVDKSKFVQTKDGKTVKVIGFTQLEGEDEMASYIQFVGPLSVCVDANNWNTYKSGILSVCGTSVDHCVQAVGVDVSGDTPYWKVRNSWATSWGEVGHIRLAYGADTCAVSSDATFVKVSAV